MRMSFAARTGLSALAISMAMTGFTPAIAQANAQANAQESDSNVEESSGGITTIVVTARRQEESMQKAAIAIDAVSGDALASGGVIDSQGLGKSVPSLSVTNGGGSNTSIIIRGVGNIVSSSYIDAAVTPSYDGVVMGRGAGAFGAAFYDLERVEVLKGPQGILYGRNATGGAVNIIPKRPELGHTGFGFNASLGNYDAVNVDGYVNVSLGDTSALRVSAMRQIHDGYNRDGTDDLNRKGVRAQLLFEPNDDLSIRLAGDVTQVRGMGAGASYIGHYAGPNFIAAPTDNSEGLNTPAANAYRQTVMGAPGFGLLDPMNREQIVHYKYYGVNAEINYETGIGTFTIIPAYRVSDGYSYFSGPAFNMAYAKEKDEQFSLEARLAGSAGIIDYVVGGFYFDESIENTGEYNQEFVLPMQTYTSGTKSIAGFGQLTANITDTFRAVGGIRYTRDKKEIDGSITNYIAFCSLPPVPRPECRAPGVLPHFPNFTDSATAFNWLITNGFLAPGTVLDESLGVQVWPNQMLPGGFIQRTTNSPSDSGSFSKVTWKAGVEYDVAPDSLLYAQVETGYRAGGFQLAEGNTTYKPETITAYTIGSKNRFWDNKVQFNVELFYWKYKNQQITYFTIDEATDTLINVTQNVGKSDIKGFDIDAIFKPFDNTTLTGKVQYLDTKYKDLHLITAPPRDNYNCPVTNTGRTTNTGAPILDFDCSGRPLIFSPKWSVNMGIEQVIPLGDWDLVADVNTSWRSKQYGQFNFLDFQLINSYWQSNASLTLKSLDQNLNIGVFVNNIEDNRQITFPQASPIGFASANYTAPRTYGVRFGAQF
ncbi:MAG: TonB-dependent receptor [Sphingomonadaceae bacterium]